MLKLRVLRVLVIELLDLVKKLNLIRVLKICCQTRSKDLLYYSVLYTALERSAPVDRKSKMSN